MPSLQFGFDRSKLLLTFLATVLILIKVMTIKIKHTCCKKRERVHTINTKRGKKGHTQREYQCEHFCKCPFLALDRHEDFCEFFCFLEMKVRLIVYYLFFPLNIQKHLSIKTKSYIIHLFYIVWIDQIYLFNFLLRHIRLYDK